MKCAVEFPTMCAIVVRFSPIAVIFLDADSTLSGMIIADERKAEKMQNEILRLYSMRESQSDSHFSDL